MSVVTQDMLAHHGVKGMHWGVIRKNLSDVHEEKVQKGIGINTRVATGTGSIGDKARVVVGTSVGRTAVRGLKGAAAKNALDQQAHLDRLNNGHAKVSDVLQKYGTLSGKDIGEALLRGRNV